MFYQEILRLIGCCLTPSEKVVSYIIELHSVKWWWCPLCTRPTGL